MASPDRPHRGRSGRTTTRPVAPVAPQLMPIPTQGLETDERYTPEWVFDHLGVKFDLDVASPPGGVPWIPCASYYTAEDDALAQEWRGFVWCNPPFSLAQAFAERFVEHGNGIGVFPLSQAKWLGPLLDAVDWMNLPINIKFESPSHSGRNVSFAVAIVGIGETARWVGELPGRVWT